jgi:aspartyl protease
MKWMLWIVAVTACAPAPTPVVVTTQPVAQHAFVFDVFVNDSLRPLRFELDSASAATYLDRRVARELGLVATGHTSVQGAGREPFQVEQVGHVTLRVGALRSTDHSVNLTDLSGLPEHLDGFLGADFISRYVVTIDYDHARLGLADPATYVYRGAGVVLPIELRRGLPFIVGEVKVAGASAESGTFLVDTGSTDAVDHPAILRSTASVRHVTTGVGLGSGTSEGAVGFGEYLQLGAYRLAAPLTACCGPNPDIASALGTEVLSRFTIVLDYARHRIILERGARFAEPFPDA